MTSLHIIQTVGSLAERSGGPARTVRDLSEALAQKGARVTLIAGTDPARDDHLLVPDPALVTTRLVPVQRRMAFPFYGFGSAIADVAVPGDAILHDHGIWSPTNVAVAAAARRFHLPMVISPHGMLEPWALAYHGGRKRFAWAMYQRRNLHQARGLCATARREADAIRARIADKPIALIPNGVTCPSTVPDRSSRQSAAARAMFYMSRLHPIKNLVTLIDAWGPIAARKEFSAWTLVIAGPDEMNHKAELMRKVATMGLRERIRIEGPIADSAKAAAFAIADIFILPSHSENFGIVVAEALAAGVPAIVSNGAPWECLVTDRCGWFTGTDALGIETAMKEAMAMKPAERLAMGKRGHALVQREFGWDGIAEKTLAYYHWLHQGGTPPDFVHG